MSLSSKQFLNHQEEEYYKEQRFLEEERNAEIRGLWKFIEEEEDELLTPISENKLYLYNSSDNINLQPDVIPTN